MNKFLSHIIPKSNLFLNVKSYYVWQYFVVYVVIMAIIDLIIWIKNIRDIKKLKWEFSRKDIKELTIIPQPIIHYLAKADSGLIYIIVDVGVGGIIQFVNPVIIKFYYPYAIVCGIFLIIIMYIIRHVLYPPLSIRYGRKNLCKIQDNNIDMLLHIRNSISWYKNNSLTQYKLDSLRIFVLNMVILIMFIKHSILVFDILLQNVAVDVKILFEGKIINRIENKFHL